MYFIINMCNRYLKKNKKNNHFSFLTNQLGGVVFLFIKEDKIIVINLKYCHSPTN